MTCEESLTEQAESVLAEMGPYMYVNGEQPRLWVYRNTIKAPGGSSGGGVRRNSTYLYNNDTM